MDRSPVEPSSRWPLAAAVSVMVALSLAAWAIALWAIIGASLTPTALIVAGAAAALGFMLAALAIETFVMDRRLRRRVEIMRRNSERRTLHAGARRP